MVPLVRVDLEDRGVLSAGVTDGLIGSSPSQGFEVLGEVVGGDEGRDMGLEAFQVVIVEDLDGGALDRAVHALGLAVGSRVIGLGQPEDIDYRPGRGLDRGYVADLLTCRWAEHQRNILMTGPTGTGKTWLACALAVQAARNGYSVRYVRTSALLTDLALAHQDGSVVRLRQALAKVKVLVLDDFGLGALTPAGKQNLLDLLDDRIGATSTIVAGQLPVEEWFDYIAEPAVADAILDRLVHSSHRLKLVGESMRKLTAAPIV